MVQRQVLRYLLVGGVGTGAHLLVLAICVEWIGLDVTVGAVLGFACALLISYVLNHKWTFESRSSHITSLWRYTAVSLSGLVLNALMVNGLVIYFGLWYLAAQLIVIWVVPASNFLLNKYWSFAND